MAAAVGPKVAPSSTTVVHQKRIEEDEVVDDTDDGTVIDEEAKRNALCATDMTFGSIPIGRNHCTVHSNAMAVVRNLKNQWKSNRSMLGRQGSVESSSTGAAAGSQT